MLIRCKCVCDMIKMHNNKMGFIKSCSHPPPCTLTHYYPVPSTPTHYFKSFLTYSHSFSVFFHPLPLMFSSLLLILNSNHGQTLPAFPAHIRMLAPNSTHQLSFQLIYSPCILCIYVLCVPLYLCPFVFHVLMYL